MEDERQVVGVVRALAAVELFAALPESTLADVARHVRVRVVTRGEIVVREGDPGDGLLVLVSGSLSFSRIGAGGERVVLHVQRAPHSLGEVSLLDGQPRSLTVEALERCTLLLLPRKAFLELVRTEPALLDALLRQLGQMVRRLSDQTSDHVFLDLGGRLAKALVQLGDELRPGTEPVVVEITQTRLAEMVGGSRQSVNQALAGFATRGLVQVNGRSLHLLDRLGLRRRARLPAIAPMPDLGPGPRGPGQRPGRPGPALRSLEPPRA